MVGRLNTTAVISAPEINSGNSQPTLLTIGFSARRTGYLNSSRVSARPRDRAVITYCLRSSSSRLARITRISPAVPAVPTTMIGIHRWLTRSSTRATLHGASMNSMENSPPTLMSK